MMQADDDIMKAFAQPVPNQQQQQQQPYPYISPAPAATATAAALPATMVNLPPTSTNPGNNSNADPLPYSLYDVILDIPHPGASHPTPIQIIYPPNSNSNSGAASVIVDTLPIPDLISEFGPDGISQSSTPTASGTAKIARFAFPEYEDSTNARDVMNWHAQQSKLKWNANNSSNLNRYDAYLEGIYSHSDLASAAGGGTSGGYGGATTGGGDNSNFPSTSLPSQHVFSHRLANGTIVHGHVRRYLPFYQYDDNNATNNTDDMGNTVRRRRDVGRRSVRAIVILTRHAGGGNRLYYAILKSIEMIILQQQMMQFSQDGGGGGTGGGGGGGEADKLRWFLHSMHQEHVNLCRTVGNAIVAEEQQKLQGNNNASSQRPALSIPRIVTLPLVELGRGHGLYGSVDIVKFFLPPSFLHGRTRAPSSSLSRNEMMPMLRTLGVPRTMRLLSALLSEKRIVLMSNDITKLSAVAYGAASMLGQGMLTLSSSSRGLFVPILPPGLASLLQTQSAYLIGVLVGPPGSTNATNYINLRSLLPSITGELVLFDLDNTLHQQQGYGSNDPYFHNVANPHQSVPDLTRRNIDENIDAARLVSSADVLQQDLNECLRSDKKLFVQVAVQEKLGMAAAKGKKAASAAVKKGLSFLRGMSERGADGSFTKSDSTVGDGEEDLDEEGDGSATVLSKLVGKGNYAYENGYSNEKSEEDARIAFTAFFVDLLGDIRAYLTQQVPGTPPVPDKAKFVKYREANGDTPGSGMYFLINNFVRSQMFDSFVEARLKEVQMRRAVPEDSPLFALVTNYHRLNKVDFSMNNVRQTVRQIAMQDNRPGRYLIDWNTKIRDRVLLLTTTQQSFNFDLGKAVSQLAEDCSESSTLLIDTMMVLWTRMQEGRGMQWKKTLLALQIFRNLLLHGPINVIAEGIDGFASIRILKSYSETMRGQNSKLIRDAASEIYSMLVDLPVLFARRRQCMNLRRLRKDPKPSPLRKETRMASSISKFRNVHIALRPAGAPVAPAPVPVADLLLQGTEPATTSTSSGSGNYSNDLLSMSFVTPSPPITTGGGGVPPMPVVAPPPAGNYSNDLLSLSFGAPAQPPVAATSKAGSGGGAMLDPFSMYEMGQAATATMLPSQPAPKQSAPQQPAPQQYAPKPTTATSVPAAIGNSSSQPFQSTMNVPIMAQNAPGQPQPAHATPSNALTSGAMAYQPGQHAQQQYQHQGGMNPYSMMPNQLVQGQPQPSPMNSSFPPMNNGGRPPLSQPMPMQPQNTMNGPPVNNPPMNNPMTFPYAQGYHQAQQPWMQGQGFPPPTQNSANIQAPAAGYPMMPMAPQYPQGAYPNATTHQNSNAQGQK